VKEIERIKTCCKINVIYATGIPSLPARHEWGESRREGNFSKEAPLPNLSPHSCLVKRGRKRAIWLATFTLQMRNATTLKRWAIFSNPSGIGIAAASGTKERELLYSGEM
jgi:hypothetical protein